VLAAAISKELNRSHHRIVDNVTSVKKKSSKWNIDSVQLKISTFCRISGFSHENTVLRIKRRKMKMRQNWKLYFLNSVFFYHLNKIKKIVETQRKILKLTKLRGLSPQANYTDGATAAVGVVVPTFADRGMLRGQRSGSPRPLVSCLNCIRMRIYTHIYGHSS
jgi:hypothetical protein